MPRLNDAKCLQGEGDSPPFCGKCRFFCSTRASASAMNQHLHARLRDNRAGFNCWLISSVSSPPPFFFNLVSCTFSELFTWVILKMGWSGVLFNFPVLHLPLLLEEAIFFFLVTCLINRGSGVTPSMLMKQVWSSCKEPSQKEIWGEKNPRLKSLGNHVGLWWGLRSVVCSGQFHTSCSIPNSGLAKGHSQHCHKMLCLKA